MEEIKVPIYLMTGFLESGKTSFLNFTIQQDYFHTDGKTLLISRPYFSLNLNSTIFSHRRTFKITIIIKL